MISGQDLSASESLFMTQFFSAFHVVYRHVQVDATDEVRRTQLAFAMSHMGNPAVAPRFRRPTTWERVRWHLLFYSNEQAIQPSAALLHWHPPSYTFSIGPAPRIDVHISVPCLLFIVFSQVIDREAKNPRIAEECTAVLDTLRRLRVRRHRQKINSVHFFRIQRFNVQMNDLISYLTSNDLHRLLDNE